MTTAFLFLLVVVLAVTGVSVFAKAKRNDKSAVSKLYEQRRASGKIHPFEDAVLKSLLKVSKVTATPSKYGIYKMFSPLSSSSNPCAAPVVYGTSFGLNTCYPYVDYDTNQTFSNIFQYNSTFGTVYEYSNGNCSGSATHNSYPLNTCVGEYSQIKLFSSSSSPVVSTKPGALFTIYGSQQNCQNNTGNGIQGLIWQATTTNNCFTYDTIANMGNSSSWTCVSSSITELLYNETSTCYGQVSDGYTFPISAASCQNSEEGDFATGWVRYGCNA